MNDSLVIIPTYNERENIVRMLDTVMNLEFPFDVLVVDDGSNVSQAYRLWVRSHSENQHLLQ